MFTTPDEPNVSVPKLIRSPDWLPRLMAVAFSVAPFVTLSTAPIALVMAPSELSTRLFAVFVPLSEVAESSLMLTAPGELNVSVPKFIASPLWLPSVTLDALKLALPPALIEAPAELVIGPLATSATAPFDERAPPTLMAPVLFTLTVPPPVWLMAPSVNVEAVLVSAMPPLALFVALNTGTAFTPARLVPLTEVVAKVPALMPPVLCVIWLLEASVTAPDVWISPEPSERPPPEIAMAPVPPLKAPIPATG